MEVLVMQPKCLTLKTALEALRLAEARLSIALNWITRNYGKLPGTLQAELRRADENRGETPQHGSESNRPRDHATERVGAHHSPEDESAGERESEDPKSSVDKQIKIVDMRSITESPVNSSASIEVKQKWDLELPEHACRHCFATFESAQALSVHCLIHAKVCMVRLGINESNLRQIIMDPGLFTIWLVNGKVLVRKSTDVRRSLRRGGSVIAAVSSTNNSLSRLKSAGTRPGPLSRRSDISKLSVNSASSKLRPSSTDLSISEPLKCGVLGEMQCEFCQRSFPSDLHLKLHQKLDHQPPNPCDACGLCFTTSRERTIHMRAEHPELLIHKCSKCESTFLSKDRLHNHTVAVHMDPKNFIKCEVCNKGFSTRENLKKHLQWNHVDPNLAVLCPTCGIQIKNAHVLKAHMKGHGPRSFLCQTCGYSATTQYNLTLHMRRVHTSLRAHTCPHCPRSFKTTKCLQRHIQRHTGKNFKACPHCGIKKADGGLSNHIKIVHLGRKFKCPHCPAMFSLRAHLKNHFKLKHPDVAIPPDSELEIIFTKTPSDTATPPVTSPFQPHSHSSRSKPKLSRSKRVNDDGSSSDLSCAKCDGAVFHSHDDFNLHMLRHEKDPDYKLRRRLPVLPLNQLGAAVDPDPVQETPVSHSLLLPPSSLPEQHLLPTPCMPGPLPADFEQTKQPANEQTNPGQHNQFLAQAGGTVPPAQLQSNPYHPFIFPEQGYGTFPSYQHF